MKGTGAKRNVCPGSCVSSCEVPGCPGGVGAYVTVLLPFTSPKLPRFIGGEAIKYVGLVAAAVSVSAGGCRVVAVCLLPAVTTDVAIAVEPAML